MVVPFAGFCWGNENYRLRGALCSLEGGIFVGGYLGGIYDEESCDFFGCVVGADGRDVGQ